MSVCIVVLNWNGWEDTLECLESVFRTESQEITVVVCDNDSQDGSVERIRDWAEGKLDVRVPVDSCLRSLSFPPQAKPIPYVEYSREQAEAGGDRDVSRPLVLIRTGRNLGFAGGNNVGIRYALERGEYDAVWLLNNDVVVRPDALDALVRQLHGRSDVGMVGSTVLHYDRPEVVQSLGGCRFNRWLALPSPLGAGSLHDSDGSAVPPAANLAYVSGASMLVSLAMLRRVGVMSEEYFLYFEELDWALRARGEFVLAHAPDSVVYHKEGRSIGGGGQAKRKSWTADYHFMRGRILITRKFAPYALPTVYLGLLLAMLRRAWRGEWDRVAMIARLWRSP